jgi:dTDP-glucose pyrophosphorylase
VINIGEDFNETLLLDPSVSLLRAMEAINENSYHMVLIVDGKRKLLGVLSDGDIRRWILKKGSLDAKVDTVMNTRPLFCDLLTSKEEAAEIMKEKLFDMLPVLDSNGILKGLHFSHESDSINTDKVLPASVGVVIMAGGTGSRLAPYTTVLPKPLIPVAGVPIIERIINKFREFKSQDFYVSVNYKFALIKAYLDLESREYNISYLEEKMPLGTGGSLGLLNKKLSIPFFVTNCDILVEANYCDIYDFHNTNKYDITVVAAINNYTVPYGVVELNESQNLSVINEKPHFTKLVNTGMYVVSPSVLKLIPPDTFFHITELIETCIASGGVVGVYPVPENSWMDMGQIDEMSEMEKRLSPQ